MRLMEPRRIPGCSLCEREAPIDPWKGRPAWAAMGVHADQTWPLGPRAEDGTQHLLESTPRPREEHTLSPGPNPDPRRGASLWVLYMPPLSTWNGWGVDDAPELELSTLVHVEILEPGPFEGAVRVNCLEVIPLPEIHLRFPATTSGTVDLWPGNMVHSFQHGDLLHVWSSIESDVSWTGIFHRAPKESHLIYYEIDDFHQHDRIGFIGNRLVSPAELARIQERIDTDPTR